MLKLEDQSYKEFIKFLHHLEPFSIKRIGLSYFILFYVWLLYYSFQGIIYGHFIQAFSFLQLILPVNIFMWLIIAFFIVLPPFTFLVARHYELVILNNAETFAFAYSIGLIISLWMIALNNSINFLYPFYPLYPYDQPGAQQYYYNEIFSFLLPHLLVASFILVSGMVIWFYIHSHKKDSLDPIQELMF